MTKTDNIAKHLDDIDFRSHEERSKQWKEDFLDWHQSLHKAIDRDGFSDLLYGQLMMLSNVLWYLLDPAEYKALAKGKVFIDVKKLDDSQLSLFRSMQAFRGSPYCDKESSETVLASYRQRMESVGKYSLIELLDMFPDLALNVAKNIVVSA